MTNWKTTFSGILAGFGQVLVASNIGGKWGNLISVGGLILLGLVSKDHNVTGGTKEQ